MIRQVSLGGLPKRILTSSAGVMCSRFTAAAIRPLSWVIATKSAGWRPPLPSGICTPAACSRAGSVPTWAGSKSWNTLVTWQLAQRAAKSFWPRALLVSSMAPSMGAGLQLGQHRVQRLVVGVHHRHRHRALVLRLQLDQPAHELEQLARVARGMGQGAGERAPEGGAVEEARPAQDAHRLAAVAHLADVAGGAGDAHHPHARPLQIDGDRAGRADRQAVGIGRVGQPAESLGPLEEGPVRGRIFQRLHPEQRQRFVALRQVIERGRFTRGQALSAIGERGGRGSGQEQREQRLAAHPANDSPLSLYILPDQAIIGAPAADVPMLKVELVSASRPPRRCR